MPDKKELSPRERELLDLAARGYLDKEIADSLGVSIHTLRTYWVRIRKKLGTKTRLGLVQAWTANREKAESLVDWTPFRRWEFDFSGGRILQFETIAVSPDLPLATHVGAPRIIEPVDFADVAEKIISIIRASSEAAAWTSRVVSHEGSRRIYLIGKAVRDEEGRLLKIVGLSFELETILVKERFAGGGMWIGNRARNSFFADAGVCSLFGIPDSSGIKNLIQLLSSSAPRSVGDLEQLSAQAASAGGGVIEGDLQLESSESPSTVRLQAITQPATTGELLEWGQLFRLQAEDDAEVASAR